MTPKEKFKIISNSAGKKLEEKWKKYLELTAGEFTQTKNQLGIVQKLIINTPKDVKSVLVVGGGDGTEIELFKNKGIKAVGISISPEEVKNGKEKGLDFRLMDMHTLEFKENEFDMIYCKDAFKQAMSPIIVWNEFVRVAKKYILISEPDERWEMRPHNFLLLTYRQFSVLAAKANWKIEAYWEIYFTFVNQRNFLFKCSKEF